MNDAFLELINISAKIEDKLILDDVSIKFNLNEVNVLLGPNGSGKSTLANVIMGNPKYKVTNGKILFMGEDITCLNTEERAKKGIFMSFQHPFEVEGVNMLNFLKTSYNILKNKNLNVAEFLNLINSKMNELELSSDFKSRFLNVGFSGGEKKKSEILQLLLFEPKIAILDEIDSGLDIDSVKLVSKVLQKYKTNNNAGFIIITHSNKILEYIVPDNVYVLKRGKIVMNGGIELIKKVETEGFKEKK